MSWLSRPELILLPALAGLLFFCGSARSETLEGRVISIDETGFTLREISARETNTPAREFRVRFVRPGKRTALAGRPYPFCVRVGRTIFLSGHWAPNKKLFLADKIRGCPNRAGHHGDPTGVRARLKRCRIMQNNPP